MRKQKAIYFLFLFGKVEEVQLQTTLMQQATRVNTLWEFNCSTCFSLSLHWTNSQPLPTKSKSSPKGRNKKNGEKGCSEKFCQGKFYLRLWLNMIWNKFLTNKYVGPIFFPSGKPKFAKTENMHRGSMKKVPENAFQRKNAHTICQHTYTIKILLLWTLLVKCNWI